VALFSKTLSLLFVAFVERASERFDVQNAQELHSDHLSITQCGVRISFCARHGHSDCRNQLTVSTALPPGRLPR
jgi:hypothetical protein